MKYPKFIKIFDMDEPGDWCARLIEKKSFNDDWYISETISHENNSLAYDEYES